MEWKIILDKDLLWMKILVKIKENFLKYNSFGFLYWEALNYLENTWQSWIKNYIPGSDCTSMFRSRRTRSNMEVKNHERAYRNGNDTGRSKGKGKR
ncbi:hypothetical protein BpHYR1_031162 [Brachionus plicatilis]|uniref:Uncharacterized protein n=1 Tax=Brachionus plicatilis TaxID=10195 RepID=A0A3M7T8H4_BRAPC|nr:hypothetical protein BpHYR1_031162 [Brachionus plicatilis]